MVGRDGTWSLPKEGNSLVISGCYSYPITTSIFENLTKADADFLKDLNVGTVKGSDGEGTVEGEFHVASAGGFFARRGDLLGEIGGRDDALGNGDAVVWYEDDLEFAADTGVMVHLCRECVDGVNDVFGEVVAWGGLGTDNEDSRRDVELWVF